MTHDEMVETVACQVCRKPPDLPPDECHRTIGRNRPLCRVRDKCRVFEKSEQQLIYTLSSPEQNLFLEACPGSGKTEVVGLKAAYEIQRWDRKPGGIAVLTFTNNAENVIRERVCDFAGAEKGGYPHYIGTIDSWLHRYIAHPFGHELIQYRGANGDCSMRVIDPSSSAGFLNAFKTKYGVAQKGNVFANHFYFDLETKKFVFHSANEALDHARNSASLPGHLIKDLRKTKCRFLKCGFATYADIEYLCFRILAKKTAFTYRLSQRFPFIIVDECQDLSWIQLQILNKLRQAGTVLHLVGDLNQAIFEFKKVNPQNVQDFVTAGPFQTLRLASNYRSCQPIVDVCQRIIPGTPVLGEPAISLTEPCVCRFYSDSAMSQLSVWFEHYLAELGLDKRESAILARSWKNVGRLRAYGNTEVNNYQKRLAMAIHLWRDRNIQSIDDSLKYLGRFFAERYFKNHPSNSRRYYCPECVSSPMIWRIFLSRVLDECLKTDTSLIDLSQTWSQWVKCVRGCFAAHARACFPILEDVLTALIQPFHDLDGKTFPVPRNLGGEVVQRTPPTDAVRSSPIRITTIHSVKGQTFDAVLLVSAPTTRTTDGHWTRWLENPQFEAARLAYVASSRPRNLLVWAIPEPTDDQKSQIEQLGFHILEQS